MADKKKWKKRIKKALKGAAIAGGALLAAKALKGKGTGLTGSNKFLFSSAAGGAKYPTDYARAKRLMTSDDAYAPKMPANLTPTMGNTGPNSMGNTGPNSMVGYGHPLIQGNVIKKGMYKSGGRVGVGKAKRGFGRALKKGK